MMEEIIVNNMEMDDIYEEEQLNQIEMEESEKNNKEDLPDLLDNEIKFKDNEIESEQNIKQIKEYKIDSNDELQKMLLPNSIGKDFLSNIRPTTENLNLCKSQYKNVGFGQYKNVGFPTFLYWLFSLHPL